MMTMIIIIIIIELSEHVQSSCLMYVNNVGVSLTFCM